MDPLVALLTTVFTLCLIAVPVIALVACVACRRHGLLLRLGGISLLLGLVGLGRVIYRGGLSNAVGLSLFAAGLILLIGGLVRWGIGRRLGRGAAEGDQPRAGGRPGSGGSSAR